jgi:D-serine dehydratase
MAPFMSGCYSLEDQRMYRMLAQLADTEGLRLEPSALAGMYGPVLTAKDPVLSAYPVPRENAVQLVWATGGSMVPPNEKQAYYEAGKSESRHG